MRLLKCTTPSLSCTDLAILFPVLSASSWAAEMSSLKQLFVSFVLDYCFLSFLHQECKIVQGVLWIKSNSQPLQLSCIIVKLMEL